jgi:Mlc titration factor MtfA (ptsG expression regulator)/uncharacterized protein Veg
LLEFLNSKTFVGHSGLVVTDEMRILISATAIQLTFGLDNYKLSSLHTINIFPTTFYSQLFKTSFKGLTSRNGVMSISWQHFVSGNAIDNDKLNLGLHEFAHALIIDLHDKNKFNNHFSNYLNTWKKETTYDFHKLKANRSPFLRAYGGTSMHEFFSVCIEHFFEQPFEFEKQLPYLYGQTAILLNQDIGNSGDDFKLKKGYNYLSKPVEKVKLLSDGNSTYNNSKAPENPKFERFVRAKGLYLAMALTVLGFVGIPILFWFAAITVIEMGTLLLLLFFCGTLGLLQWKYVKHHIDMAYHQFAMYAYVGFGITLLNLLFFINYSITINSYSKKYEILRAGYYSQFVIKGDDINRALERNLNSYIKDYIYSDQLTRNVTISFDTGLLGFDVVKKCEFN